MGEARASMLRIMSNSKPGQEMLPSFFHYSQQNAEESGVTIDLPNANFSSTRNTSPF